MGIHRQSLWNNRWGVALGRWATTCCAFALAVGVAAAADAECRVRSFSLNAVDARFDGQWQGIATATDGACYFATSSHSPDRGAGFFRFDPDEQKVHVLAEDLTRVCGENPAHTPPQGKVHSPIVEHNGWLYFATHLANYWPQARRRYPGAHVLGYELTSGRFRDFGVIRKGFSIYSAVQVDPANGQLYTFVVPFAEEDVKHHGTTVYRIDIETGRKQCLDPVVSPKKAVNFGFFVDRDGTCWFAPWRIQGRTVPDSGQLFCVNAGSGVIQSFADVLPTGQLAPDGVTAARELQRGRSWTWVDPLPGRTQALFTMGHWGGGDERLWMFDPAMEAESGEAFTSLGYIGSTFLSVARGGDRVYFVQYRNLEDARRTMPESVRERNPEALGFPAYLHLRSVSVAPGASCALVDHGMLVDHDGRLPRMIESLAANEHGEVFMVGSWNATTPEESTHQYIWQDGQFGTDAQAGHYRRLDRGEFFAYVNVSDDLEHD